MSEKKEKKIETPIGVVRTKAPNALSPRRVRVQLHTGPGLTEQSHKDDCDINLIIKKFAGDDLRQLQSNKPALYGDFASAPSFEESLQIVIRANEQFAGLPSKVRKEFDNNPQAFLEFASNPKNGERLVELGLAKKPAIIDPPASRGDIEKLSKAISSPKGKSPPAGGSKGEDDPS